MSQGLRTLLAAVAAIVLLPSIRAGEPETQINCKIWVVRVNDECFDRLRAMVNCPANCCEACPSCPHTPCEQKCATAACCEQKCGSEKACGKSCCEAKCCDTAKSRPATLPTVLDARVTARMMEMCHDQAGCEAVCMPQVTTLNGQSATISVENNHAFVTNVHATKMRGQSVVVPNNELFSTGFHMTIVPTMTPDRQSIIMNLRAQQTELDCPTAPLFPIQTTITPVFEGGAQGQPVPFTQFIQQPSFTTRGMHKFVACSDGQTIVLDCGRRTRTNETVSELPVLCDLPVVGELFRSKSTEVVSDRLLVFVTPHVLTVDSGEESSAETTNVELPLFAQPIMCEEGMREPVRPTVEFLPIAPRPMCAPAVMPAGHLPCGSPCQACPVPAPLMMGPMPPSAGGGVITPGPTAGSYVVWPEPCACPLTAPAMPTPTARPMQAVPPMMAAAVCCPFSCQVAAPVAMADRPSQQVMLDLAFVLVDDDFFNREDSGRWAQFAPKASDAQSQCVCGELASLFLQEARAKGCAKFLARPQMIGPDGRPFTFLSGGQVPVRRGVRMVERDGQAVPEVELGFEPVGVQATFQPVVSADGRCVELAMELRQSEVSERNGKCAAPGQVICEQPMVGSPTINLHESKATALLPAGRTLMHCVRTHCNPGKAGEHLYVLATPHLLRDSPAAYAPAMPTPAQPAVAVAAMTAATPPMMVRQVAAVAQPCCSSADLQLVHLMIEYHEACAAGDRAKARNLAARCIALDPTCFSR